MRGDLVRRSRTIRSRILQWVGIPTCVGMGQTKTLAKLANHIAKTAERKPGIYPEHLAQVCTLSAMTNEDRHQILSATDVQEVWGVGPRIGKAVLPAEFFCRTCSKLTHCFTQGIQVSHCSAK